MGRMNIYFSDEEDDKLDRLKIKFKIKSKEDVIKRLIKQFPENNSDVDLTIEDELTKFIADDLI